MKNDLIEDKIKWVILSIRGQRVILDADLAMLYKVPTKVLNQAVKRNRLRFPADFMFKLTEMEMREVVTNCDHLHKLKYSYSRAYAFTEHGAVMLANVLNSSIAVRVSLQVVRTFVRLRMALATHGELARKLELLEKKYDRQFRFVFDAIKELMTVPEKPKRQIGFSHES